MERRVCAGMFNQGEDIVVYVDDLDGMMEEITLDHLFLSCYIDFDR